MKSCRIDGVYIYIVLWDAKSIFTKIYYVVSETLVNAGAVFPNFLRTIMLFL